MKLTIEKIVYGGQGLARIPETEGALAGKRIFVPFTLPGEQVVVEMDSLSRAQDKRGYVLGRLQQIETASPLRVQPDCQHFTHCGGCQLQHASYAGQLDVKRTVLREALDRAGVRQLPKISLLHGDPLAYRNRMRVHVQTQPHFAIGYQGKSTHTIIPIEQCSIVAPPLQHCLHALREMGEAGSIPQGIEEIECFTNHDGSAVLLSAFMSQSTPCILDSCEKFFIGIAAKIPELSGAALVQRGMDRAISFQTQTLLRWKAQSVDYRVGAQVYRVSIGSFFQINRSLLPAFVAQVAEEWSGKQAWDLYAGVGLFSRVLAEQFSQVTAVEIAPAAVDDLRHNLAALPATIIASTTEDFLRHTLEQRIVSPDLVLLDPPRAGLGLEGVNLLARCRPKRIVYVSCDPVTLSRDLKALIESGYRLDRLHMVDMFPQTYHQETIAVLVR